MDILEINLFERLTLVFGMFTLFIFSILGPYMFHRWLFGKHCMFLIGFMLGCFAYALPNVLRQSYFFLTYKVPEDMCMTFDSFGPSTLIFTCGDDRYEVARTDFATERRIIGYQHGLPVIRAYDWNQDRPPDRFFIRDRKIYPYARDFPGEPWKEEVY